MNYSAKNGGFYQVEIRLFSRNDEWCLDCITNLIYMVTDPELEKEIDISWSQRYTFGF
ncbi:DUF2787 family protein [Pantoea sp. paga]|uniref:DUF2787 family protein n=1 Tax=Pantoea sp. paga TaxID=2597519 RepID=UPI00117DAA6A|nr:DUF2787 domain-containing protein [Pantoea sp. paga]